MKLKFNNPELESGYQQDYSQNLRFQSAIAVGLATILYLLFGLLDLYIVPEQVKFIWGVRALVVGCFLISLLLIFSEKFIRHNQLILAFTALVCMGGLFAMLATISDVSESRYYASMMLVIPWLYVALGLRTANAFYINIFLLIFYNAETAYLREYPVYIFMNNNFFLVSLSVLSFASGYLIERNRRTAYAHERSLVLLKNKAESANAAKTRFLAAASHDLRQPVHAIGLFLDALSDIAQETKQQKIISKIKNSSKGLERLLESILDISKLEAGAINIHIQKFEIQALFNTLDDEFKGDAQEKGLSIRFMPTNLWANTDRSAVERILRNLISNAIRYTDSGRILVGCRRRPDSVIVGVYDTGIGIDADKTQVIFEEFHQLDNPGRNRSKGLGLGLSIVERLAGLLAAKLAIKSTPGKGSMFTVELPRHLPADRMINPDLP